MAHGLKQYREQSLRDKRDGGYVVNNNNKKKSKNKNSDSIINTIRTHIYYIYYVNYLTNDCT